MQRLWWFSGHVQEALSWISAVLPDLSSPPADVTAATYARALADFASLTALVGTPLDMEHPERVLAIARDVGDTGLLIQCLIACGSTAAFDGERARPYLDEADALARDCGDKWRLSQILWRRAYVAIHDGDPHAAITAGEEGRDLADEQTGSCRLGLPRRRPPRLPNLQQRSSRRPPPITTRAVCQATSGQHSETEGPKQRRAPPWAVSELGLWEALCNAPYARALAAGDVAAARRAPLPLSGCAQGGLRIEQINPIPISCWPTVTYPRPGVGRRAASVGGRSSIHGCPPAPVSRSPRAIRTGRTRRARRLAVAAATMRT
jgi:hypothetical protein